MLACVVVGVVLELSFVVSGDHVLIVLQGALTDVGGGFYVHREFAFGWQSRGFAAADASARCLKGWCAIMSFVGNPN